jgi:small GTP-binding protein
VSRPVVAIVGRPNVGKSTLFNRLLGRRKALAADQPGVTRDRNYAVAELLGREVLLCDTGGFEVRGVVVDDVMARLIREQALVAVEEADVVVFVMDVREGLVATDLDIAARLRESKKPVIFTLNKADHARVAEEGVLDFYRLGVDEFVPLSAEHGLGVADLAEAIVARLPAEAGAAGAAAPRTEPWDESGRRRKGSRKTRGRGRGGAGEGSGEGAAALISSRHPAGGRLYFFGDDMPAEPTSLRGPRPEAWDPRPQRGGRGYEADTATAVEGLAADAGSDDVALEPGEVLDEEGRRVSPLRLPELAGGGEAEADAEALPPDFEAQESADFVPRIAILGRPNVGKSTLLNRLLGYQRSITSPIAGTTHDVVDACIERDGRRWVLIDTAGVRRKARVERGVEQLTVGRAIRSVEAAHVCLLVLDGSEGVTEQEARLGAIVADRGRALVLLVNKWDLQAPGDAGRREFLDGLRRRFPHLGWADVLFLSALTGRGLGRVWSSIERANQAHRLTVRTGPLNRWARAIWAGTPPPQHLHRPVRMYYCAQTDVRPPTFVLFCNQPEAIPQSYRRFLENQLRLQFPAPGSPVRLQFRSRGGS